MAELHTPGIATLERSHQGQLQFLTFRLTEDTQAMISVQVLAEILTPSLLQVVPIPGMPAWVLGAYNWRGEILWVVDLAQFLGLGRGQILSQTSSTCTVLITHIQHHRLGLVVSQVSDMLWCNPDDVESAPGSAVTPDLAPVLQGYTLGSAGEILLALDVQAIQQRALQLSDQHH
jgi:positive phototaxis protein PixI